MAAIGRVPSAGVWSRPWAAPTLQSRVRRSAEPPW